MGNIPTSHESTGSCAEEKTIDDIEADLWSSDQPDYSSEPSESIHELEKIAALEREKAKFDSDLENQKKWFDAQMQAHKQHLELRKEFSTKILYLLFAWILIVIIGIFASYAGENKMPLAGLIVLITTSTANMLVLPFIILRNLFPDNSKQAFSHPFMSNNSLKED